MATNPFEDEDGRYYALINDEGQYSLWPTFADVPDGWSIAHGEDSRQACLDYIEENWTDMRPNSLIRQMQEYEESKKLFRFARNRTLIAAGPRPARSPRRSAMTDARRGTDARRRRRGPLVRR